MSRPEDNVQYSSDVLDAADPRAQAFAEHDAARNSIDEVLDNWAQKVSPRILPSELGGTLPGDDVAGLRVQVSSRVENSQQYLTVPDYRTPADKLRDFVGAAAHKASTTSPESYRAYLQQELDKFTGVGEGLNDAKEDVKSAGAAAWKAVTDGTAEKEITSSAAVGWKALTDGTVAKFLARPNAINDPLFHTVGDALNAIPKDPEGARCALEALGKSIQQASDRYSALPAREQGHVIGKLAFYTFAGEVVGAGAASAETVAGVGTIASADAADAGTAASVDTGEAIEKTAQLAAMSEKIAPTEDIFVVETKATAKLLNSTNVEVSTSEYNELLQVEEPRVDIVTSDAVSIRDLIDGPKTSPMNVLKSGQQYLRVGDMQSAINDFYSMKPRNIEVFQTEFGQAFKGELPDGGTIGVRPGNSNDSTVPTLQLNNPEYGAIKFRYKQGLNYELPK